MQTKHLTNNEVAHYYANQISNSGSNGKGSFWFEGGDIYSYRTKIATFTKVKGGRTVLFLTSKQHSNTTSSHISEIVNACSHYKIIDVVNVDAVRDYNASSKVTANDKAILAGLIESSNESILYASRARLDYSIQVHINQANDDINTYNDYCKYFGIKRKKLELITESNIVKKEGDVKKANIVKKKQAEKMAKEIRIRRLEEYNLELEEWLNFELDRFSYRFMHNDVKLRINVEKGVIETTKNANIPIKHGLKLWKLIKKVKSSGKEVSFEKSIFKLGVYKLNYIAASGNIVAGCHNVEYSELERIGEQLEKGI